MDPLVEDIYENIEKLDLPILGRFTLGLCEHFTHAADYLQQTDRFSQSLMTLWEWHLGIVNSDPQSVLVDLVESLPEIDPDAESNLSDDILISSSVLLGEACDTLRGDAGMGRHAFSMSCDLIVEHALLLGMDTEAAHGKHIMDALSLYPVFCQDYVCLVKEMLHLLPEAGFFEIGEWRIDQQKWGHALRDRLANADEDEA